MKQAALIFFVVIMTIVLSTGIYGQTDDIRQATGLPIPIGAPVIYGEVKIRNFPANAPKPTVFVSLIVGGSRADRMQTNERNYYYFLKSPNDGATLVFEVNNQEVGRAVLSVGTGSSVRQDIELDWQQIDNGAKTTPGVVSLKGAYSRSSDAERNFDKAITAVKAKKPDEAIAIFKQIVEKDPKDFVAWTELGTVYFGQFKFPESENSYGKAIELKADFMAALMNMGKLQLSQKRFDQAAAFFYKAVSADATSSDAFQYLGESYLQAKQGSKAVIAFNEALRLAPLEKAEIHLRLATLYNAAGAKDRAIAEYKAFLEKVPQYPDKDKLEKYIKDNSK